MKNKRVISFLFGLFLIFTVPMSSSAYDLPSVNLGFTSFMDGAPPSGPGLYFTQYAQYWTSDEFNDNQGNALLPAAAGEDLDAWISLSQFIYQSDTEVMLGAKWGLDVIIPYVILDLRYENPGPYPEDNGSGVGDLLIGPYLQWDPIMGANGPILMQRIEFQCIFPIGEYMEDKELNPSSNFFSFNPYYSATIFITPKFTFSTRIHYLWNDKNDKPNRAYAAMGGYETQAGRAIHLNFAWAYEIVPNQLRIGINGYYLHQITDTEMNGIAVRDVPDVPGVSKPPYGREKVLAIGPGLLYHINKDSHFFVNMFFEAGAENRPEGTRINFRFVHHF